MGTKMTHSARAELTNAVRRRYSAATGAEKRTADTPSLSPPGNIVREACGNKIT